MNNDKPLGQLNYEQFADRYAAVIDTKPHNAYLERPATLSLLPDVNGLHVLDAGCGPGVYAEWLLERGARVSAFDVTPQMVEITRQRIGTRFEGRFDVRTGDLLKSLDWLQDGTFDLVVCPLVLDYIEDWSIPFREFQRVLKSGGTLVFSAGHPTGDYVLLKSENYFAVELFGMHWRGFGEPQPLVQGYRRPLAAMLNPLIETGFMLDRVLEAQPTEHFKAVNPDDYERFMHQPTFICIRAKRL